MKVLFTESKFWDKRQDFQKRYEAKILRAASAAQKLLTHAPADITFVVQMTAYECIPETGDGGFTKNSRLIILSIDPGLPYGEEKLLPQVRHTVFHELNHSARYEQGFYHKHFLDQCIMDGLATAFERDYADSPVLYGQYDKAEAAEWLQEIVDKGITRWSYDYMVKHEDGRRWIGYKVGTYIVDEAKKKSGKSIPELTKLSCDDIKNLSGLL